MKNPWINYIGRSYATIKSSLLNSLSIKVPEFSNYSPSNLFMILLDMFASVSEVLNYYIDSYIRELYPITARRISSLLKLANFVNYFGKAKIAASVDLLFTFEGTGSKPSFLIPKDLNLVDSIGNTWKVSKTVAVNPSILEVMVSAIQVSKVDFYKLGTSTGEANQKFLLPEDYSHNSLEVVIDGQIWTRKETLGFSSPIDKHFTVELYADNKIYLIFGNGVTGDIPLSTKDIYISYYSTKGINGNIPKNQTFTVTDTLIIPNGFTLTITNPNPAYGGFELEDIDRLRKNIPISLRTLNRAVTRQDYEDIASLAPGIRLAKLDYEYCKSSIDIYIAPNEGGLPSEALITSTKEFVENHGIFTLPITIKASGEAKVRIKLQIYGEYGISKTTIEDEVKNVLSQLYNSYNTPINKPILISDIIASVHNLKEVNNTILEYVYLVPYLRCNNLSAFLDYDIKIRTGSNDIRYWNLVYEYNTSKFLLICNGEYVAEFGSDQIGFWQEDVNGMGILDIIINEIVIGSANSNIIWEFYTYPYNTNIMLNDYSIPVLDVDNLSLETIEYVRSI